MSKSPSLRRIKADIRELSIDPSDQYHAAPLEHDMFEWHFTIRGAPDTDFAGGVYHGRILLPSEYPFKPPNIVFLTPSGRFECGVKVCLSFSAHHPELWQPAWGIRLILEALISFLPTPADGAIGALDWTSEERKKLAKESVKFRCPVCCCEGETCEDLIPKVKPKRDTKGGEKTKFQEEIEKLKMLQFQNHAVEEDPKAEEEGESRKEGESKSDEFTEEKTSAQELKGGGASPSKPPADSLPHLKSEEPPSPLKAVEQKAEKNTSPTKSAASTPIKPSPPESKTSHQKATDNNTTTSDAPIPVPPVQVNPNNQQPRSETDQAATPAARNTAPAGIEDSNNNQDDYIVSDSLLNGMIGFFAAIVLVLLRQAQSLVDELHSFGDESEK